MGKRKRTQGLGMLSIKELLRLKAEGLSGNKIAQSLNAARSTVQGYVKLAGCTWINNKHNLFITGPTGIGKSFLACALADRACRLGLKPHYFKAAELITQLLITRADGSYPRLAQKMAKTHLLLIDEWLLDPLPQIHAREILELLDDRFRKASTIFISQLPVRDWHKNIGDPTLADAILDRVIHDAFRLDLSGESMRKLTTKIQS